MSAPKNYSGYRYPGEGESASQYSSPSAPASTDANADNGYPVASPNSADQYSSPTVGMEQRSNAWNYVDTGNLGALANDDYREDGALPAGGPAWGVTDESTGDSADYGPGVDTMKVP